MATPYSDDLRRKVLEAYQRNEGSLNELSVRFSVSEAWAKKISARLRRTGKMERELGRKRGPASKVTPEIEQDLKDWIGKQADLTLSELQARLMEQRSLKISLSRLWTVLKQLGMRFKKSRSTPPSKTPQQAAKRGRTGARQPKGSRPTN